MAVRTDKIGGLWLVYGIPGTGKTLLGGLADGLVPAVQHGRTVYTNITGLSVMGIASVCGVAPICVDVRFLESIQDIIAAFDSEDCKGALFILDEMKQVLARDKQADSWLCQRLNIMRKRGNDFIMIAQVPTYFSTEVRELAKGCTVYKRLYAFGSKTRTREYRFDGGNPVISSGKLQPAGYSVRRLDSALFPLYTSYIDDCVKGSEDSGRKNNFWKSPKAIIAYGFIFSILLFLGFAVFMFFNIKDSVGGLTDSISGRSSASASVQQQSQKAVNHEKETDILCFNRKICDTDVCKTDAGEFLVSSWLGDVGGFVTPAGLVRRCPGN